MRKNVDSLRSGTVCQSIQDKIAAWSGRYLANIAQTGDIDYGPIEAYLNRPDVRRAIHARQGPKFTLSSDRVYKQYARGVMRNYAPVVAKLLDRGIPVMVISGLNDGKDTNFLAARRWISKMSWRKAGALPPRPDRAVEGRRLGPRIPAQGRRADEPERAERRAPRAA